MASATLNPHSFTAYVRDPNVPLRPFFTAPTNEPTLPFPGYDFPRLDIITGRLKRQFDDPNPNGIPARQRVLSMPIEDFMFVKNLVLIIETSRRSTAPSGVEDSETENRGFIKINYEILLLLISRLKKFPPRVQLEEFYRIISVIEDFGNIETCLMKQYANVAGRDTLFKLLYALDKAFEKWIYNLLDHTKSVGTSKWNQYFVEYRNELRQDLLQFTTNAEHVNICFAIQPSIVNKTTASQSSSAFGRRSRDFYMNVRNNFILVADYVGMYLPVDTHLFMQYIQNCGDYLCTYHKTISSLADLAEALGDVGVTAFESFTKTQSKVFLDLLRSYCALKLEASSNNIVQGMVALTRGYKLYLDIPETNRRIHQVAQRMVANQERIARNKKLSAEKRKEVEKYKSVLFTAFNYFTQLPTIIEEAEAEEAEAEKAEELHNKSGGMFGDDSHVRGDATFTGVRAGPSLKIQHQMQSHTQKDMISLAKDKPEYAALIVGALIYSASLNRNPLSLIRSTLNAKYFSKNPLALQQFVKTNKKTKLPVEYPVNEILMSFIDVCGYKLAYNIGTAAPKFIKKHGIKIAPFALPGLLYAKMMEDLLDMKKTMQDGLDDVTGFKKYREEKEAAEVAREAQETAREAAEEKKNFNK